MDGRKKMGARQRKLAYVSNGCLGLGLLVCLAASRFVGMPMGQNPAVTALTFVIWAVGIAAGYAAFRSGPKAPRPEAPFWVKACSYLAAQSSFFLTLAVFIGYLFWPTVEKSFIPAFNPYFLMLSLFAMGVAINTGDWKRIVQSPRLVAICVVLRWLCVPLAAYAVSYAVFIAFLPPSTAKSLALGMILLGATPTGTFSNTLTMIARGDLALSVSVTTVNTLLAPFLLPLLTLWLAGAITHVNATAIFNDLVVMVILPVGVGSILGSIFPRCIDRIAPVLAPTAVICLGLIMMGSMSKGTTTLLKQLYILWYLAAACFLLAIISLALGYYLPKLFRFNVGQRKAACFEVGVTNAALTMTLALRHFTPLSALVAILYGKIQIIVAATFFLPRLQNLEESQGAAAALKKDGPAYRTGADT